MAVEPITEVMARHLENQQLIADSKENEWGEWEEEEDAPIYCLITNEECDSVDDALDRAEKEGLPFRELTRESGIYDRMKVINYTRTKRGEGVAVADIVAVLRDAKGEWTQEVYLQPVVPNDSLLCSMETVESEGNSKHGSLLVAEGEISLDKTLSPEEQIRTLMVQNAALREESLSLKRKFKELFEEEEVPTMVPKYEPVSIKHSPAELTLTNRDIPPGLANLASPAESVVLTGEPVPDTQQKDHFFRAEYDPTWVRQYEKMFEQNVSCGLLKNKVVMDVSPGLAVTSMLAARIGNPKLVVVYDKSATKSSADLTEKIVKANHMDETVVVIRSKDAMDQLVDKAGRVGVVVCPWTVQSLLPTEHLTHLIECRDAFLKPGGTLLPDMFTLNAAGFSIQAANLLNQSDFDFTPFNQDLRETCVSNSIATRQKLPQSCLTTYSNKFKVLDLCTSKVSDTVQFSSNFVLSPILAHSKVSGLVCPRSCFARPHDPHPTHCFFYPITLPSHRPCGTSRGAHRASAKWSRCCSRPAPAPPSRSPPSAKPSCTCPGSCTWPAPTPRTTACSPTPRPSERRRARRGSCTVH